ncbi:lipopolysaccharide assembly protein LapA domain-containing protein [Amycolatopsis rhabdoformis]|uniref:Lipopolysaccharide assembly protein LapA domain-containing protein n=1 Tax=Amycolatopsis rhabdoformis TaxID=1448059 RepID=A0ABZ1HZS0_9PSEU|nr:lipopolysaccharide assembly protein LapA domain-containing protein [Amycolatopsis rhabdoformis]WSE27628.1 lipopolysaccharide assembly protein LapA domain-containing protein [Amycolatopsis rhabdoformis]
MNPGTPEVPGVEVPGTDPITTDPAATTTTTPSTKRPTRVSGAWVSAIVAIVLLAFLLVFILQNLNSVTVNFLGMSGSLPIGIAMLLAALGGMVVIALVGGARIMQLRKQSKRLRK